MLLQIFHKIKIFLLPFLGGALYALGFPTKSGFFFFLFSLIGITFLLYSWRFFNPQKSASLTHRLLSTLYFSIGYNLVGYYWIPHTLSEFGDIPFPWNQVLSLFFSLIIAPQLYVFLIFTALLHWILRKQNVQLSQSCLLITYSLALTFFEYITPQQFPAHLGHPWLQLAPYLGLAPVLGAPFFSFVSYLMCWQALLLLYKQKLNPLVCLTSCLFIGFNISLPLSSDRGIDKNHQSQIGIRFVQGNVGNFVKLSSEAGHVQSIQEVYDRFYNLSVRPFKYGDNKLDLIIWPETSYPHLINSNELRDSSEKTPPLIKKILNEIEAELFIGGYDKNPEASSHRFESEYNSAFHFSNDAKIKNVYHKRILIPFGEGLPFGPFNQVISESIDNIAFFARGENFPLFYLEKENTPFISLICYEVLFSSFLRNYLNALSEAPHFIINITNDSWYGDTSEPHQHLFLSKWRALEFQIPILRMTNTGITSVIYPDGSESERLGVFKMDTLDIMLQTSAKPASFFQRFGIIPTLLIGLTLLLLQFLWELKSRPSLK